MSVNAIGHILRRLKISRGGITALNYTTSCAAQNPPGETIPPLDMKYFSFTPNLRSPLSPHLKTLEFPLQGSFPWKIIETPPRPTYTITDLPKTRIIPLTDKIPDNSLEMPSEHIIEKQAARLIVIRRRKMRRHKLRKLRKRMKFIRRKWRQRRELKKEKAFQAELIAQIKEAESFDARGYVDSRLQILDNVRIPSKWRGEVLPENMIRQFLKEKEERRWKKLNRPKITLD
ncbi:uncharacterized protein LOC107040310 [Diachasma alloeum]|uniref:uncharacterized protein LOC107040310 n=1 Tax=Diachasma alloeum TaxID=454923 RepID=UPI0007383A81|nr:uncharacterized protein LOC107040310 [Diachasma alloeum]